MTLHDFILKCKKRIHYRFTQRKSIETYFMRVIDSTFSFTTFDYYGIVFKARLKHSSDYDMVHQVLVEKEYATALSFFSVNNIIPMRIVDAGSNIGSFAIFVKHLYPNVQISCIEPDRENFKILESNLKPFQEESSIQLYQAGLMAEHGLYLAIDDTFRGGSHCSRQVVFSDKSTSLKSVSMQSVLNDRNWGELDFLKIDIEGAETFLINPKTDISFLKKTKVIAIEIHDETNARKAIYSLLQNEGFMLLEDNETTIAVNKLYV